MNRPNSHGNLARLALVALLTSAACSDDKAQDGGDSGASQDVTAPQDYKPLPEGWPRYKCTKPGKACNAHDPCAINPICGKDLICRPERMMNCDDGLACTTDICASAGVCKNNPKPGSCKIGVRVPKGTKCSGVKMDAGTPTEAGADASGVAMETIFCCFSKGDKKPGDPCMACQPTTDDAGVSSNNTRWSGASGGSCDDGNQCTKSDACQGGTCKGISFASLCSDGYGCTKDICDGKGGCLGNTLMSGFCLINATCYKDGTNNPSGACGTCDTSKSTSTWTTISNACLINGKCYSKGQKNTNGCGICDPSQSTSAWSPVKNTCLIAGKCHIAKTKHAGGCAECDPAKSGTTWTVIGATHCLIDNKCVASGTKHPGGCHKCDPAKSKTGWTGLGGACGKCLPFKGTIGAACTTANQATKCGTSGLCLLTQTNGGVCTQYCTADNPATSINEDTCPNKPANECAPIPLSSGKTSYFCVRKCSPYIGCNECESSLLCHPQSGSLIGLPGKGVCLLYKSTNGCAKNSDCAVTTGKSCNTKSGGCPSGQTCQALAQDTTWSSAGTCVKDGVCDTVSGLCKPKSTGTSSAEVGDPCAGDNECAAGQTCLQEFNEKTLRKPGGYSCTYGTECCSGTCTNKSCVGGNCDLLWRNGYCAISNCIFSKTLTNAACPSGTLCNRAYRTGLCQPTCSLNKASDCRGQTKDLYGDYECRDWSQVTYSHGKASTGPVCDLGPLMPCSSTSATGTIKKCEVFGDKTNSTAMHCRDLKGNKLSNPQHASGYCLDKTASGPIMGAKDGGVATD